MFWFTCPRWLRGLFLFIFLKNLKFILFHNVFMRCQVRTLTYAGCGVEILLTVKELAAALKLTEQTVKRYVLRNEIPYRKVFRAVRFRPSEINEWINNGGLNTGLETGGGLPDDAGAGLND
jgi:excisionase family DNA binding protein